jgi:hypothetical protein
VIGSSLVALSVGYDLLNFSENRKNEHADVVVNIVVVVVVVLLLQLLVLYQPWLYNAHIFIESAVHFNVSFDNDNEIDPNEALFKVHEKL